MCNQSLGKLFFLSEKMCVTQDSLCVFQGLMILLQNLPTMHWGNEEVSVLLAEAYRLKFAFADAPNHYKR